MLIYLAFVLLHVTKLIPVWGPLCIIYHRLFRREKKCLTYRRSHQDETERNMGKIFSKRNDFSDDKQLRTILDAIADILASQSLFAN